MVERQMKWNIIIFHSAIIAGDISMTWADSNIKVRQLLIQAENVISS